VDPGAERLGTEIKLPLDLEPKLRIAAAAPFYLRNIKAKIMDAEEFFVNCYNFNPIT
jgi:hypothetical protein